MLEASVSGSRLVAGPRACPQQSRHRAQRCQRGSAAPFGYRGEDRHPLVTPNRAGAAPSVYLSQKESYKEPSMISTCNTAGAFFYLRGVFREQRDSTTLEEKYFFLRVGRNGSGLKERAALQRRSNWAEIPGSDRKEPASASHFW